MPKRRVRHIYILASRSHQLYVGMTNSLERRMEEHRAAVPGHHTARYRINRLVYFEHTQYVLNAIAREKELKEWTRAAKIELVESINPTWDDLSEDWGEGIRRMRRNEERAKANADSLRE